VWTDVSGNNNSGSLVNSPTFDSGNGGSIVFNGTAATTANRIDTSLQYEKNQSFTLSCWAFGTSTRTFQVIMGGLIGNNMSMGLRVTPLQSVSIHTLDTVDKTLVTSAADTFPLNTWTHIAGTVVYDGPTTSATSGTATIFINGSQVATNTFTNLTTYNRNMVIGSPSNNTLNRAFEGRIATSQVYNLALTATEILQNYNATRSRFGI
jgi:hypothetical protein